MISLKEKKERECEYCGKTYTPTAWHQKFCNPKCREKSRYKKVFPKKSIKPSLTINEIMRIGREHGIYNNYGKIVGMIERGEIRI